MEADKTAITLGKNTTLETVFILQPRALFKIGKGKKRCPDNLEQENANLENDSIWVIKETLGGFLAT